MSKEAKAGVTQLPLFGCPSGLGGSHFSCSLATAESSVQLACSHIDTAVDRDEAVYAMVRQFLPYIDSTSEIWIKPNVTSVANMQQGKTSSPEVLSALILALVRAGASVERVTVADCSVIGTDTYEAARECGILDACERNGVEFLDLRTLPYVVIPIDHPRKFPELHISEAFVRSGVVKINLAKIKTSYGSPAAFSIKNAKGVITDEEKLAFHLRGVQASLCDLNRAVRWDMTILEGFPASGLGGPADWNVLIASSLPIAVDLTACALAGIPLADAGHLQLIAEEEGLDADGILDCLGASSLRAHLPRLAYTANACKELEGRHGVRILDGHPCSGCVESLSKALSRRRAWPQLLPPSLMAVGSELRYEDLSEVTHFVGNCSFDAAAMRLVETNRSPGVVSAWREGVKIAGCPPTIDTMASVFSTPRDVVGARRVGRIEAVRFSLSEDREDQLARAQFAILPLQVTQTAAALRGLQAVVPREQVTFVGLPRELALRCELVAAGICHQMNWDFLRQRILQRIQADSTFVDSWSLAEASPATIATLLDGYDRPERVRAAERAGMLRDIGWFIAASGDSIEAVLAETNNLSAGPTGLCSVIERCSVFREDPERKKLNVFVHGIIRSGLWQCVDQDALSPTIDYHILRLVLRRGDVWPRNASYLRALREETPQRALTAARLRRVVAQALQAAAAQADLPVPTVNHVEWWVGRSVCTRDNPGCDHAGEQASWLSEYGGAGCPYRGHCVAYNEDHSRMSLQEPLFEGRFY